MVNNSKVSDSDVKLQSYISNIANHCCLLVITSLAKEVMFLVALVSLSVCLSVCLWTTLLKKL